MGSPRTPLESDVSNAGQEAALHVKTAHLAEISSAGSPSKSRATSPVSEKSVIVIAHQYYNINHRGRLAARRGHEAWGLEFPVDYEPKCEDADPENDLIETLEDLFSAQNVNSPDLKMPIKLYKFNVNARTSPTAGEDSLVSPESDTSIQGASPSPMTLLCLPIFDFSAPMRIIFEANLTRSGKDFIYLNLIAHLFKLFTHKDTEFEFCSRGTPEAVKSAHFACALGGELADIAKERKIIVESVGMFRGGSAELRSIYFSKADLSPIAMHSSATIGSLSPETAHSPKSPIGEEKKLTPICKQIKVRPKYEPALEAEALPFEATPGAPVVLASPAQSLCFACLPLFSPRFRNEAPTSTVSTPCG